ncbi:MAG: hypothetical protein ACUVR2_10670 [Anaerolineae bacterium]
MNPICANCGIEITWQPTIVDGRTYCCAGCALGGPCTCDYSNLPRIEESRAIVCHTPVIILPPHREEKEQDGTGCALCS